MDDDAALQHIIHNPDQGIPKMNLTRLFAVATLSMVALCAHAAPPSKDGGTSSPQPFQFLIQMTIPNGKASQFLNESIAVPVGKRAMLENYSYLMT